MIVTNTVYNLYKLSCHSTSLCSIIHGDTDLTNCYTNTLFTRHKTNRSVPKITEPYRARNRAGVRLHYIKNNRAESIIEDVIEHVGISISALQLARASSMATSRLRKVSRSAVTMYAFVYRTPAVGVEATPGRVRRCSFNAEQDNMLCLSYFLSQLLLATLKAPRREWVRLRYVVHSVSAHCGHTVFVRFRYWIETASRTVLTVLARHG